MIFFVFSYNRGPHLRNCIDSIERCAAKHTVIIYDDGSDDPETQHILADIEKRHEVKRPRKAGEESQHGALYANMQRAIESVEENELICFLQDDTQLVREIDEHDIHFLEHYFNTFPNGGFLAPVFQKQITRQSTRDRFVFYPERGVYVCEHQSRKPVAGVYYSDISITRRDRLKEANWSFLANEFDNEQQAKQHFLEMGYLPAPFAMWLPNPPAYRNKQKSFTFRLAEIVNQAGFYPFNLMDSRATKALRERPTNSAPIAEDYLSVAADGLRTPWIYDPLRRYRLLRKLAKLEGLLSRLKHFKS
ncbi:glycosyltransferase family 2 protein [Vreelandella aquamarina]|uniref:glycosyltransferase n=1 Tax=Vreelandella aquamarina TaxID=77097 RepID=UPI00384E7CFC